MTLTQAQTALHKLYIGDNDVPTASDDDWAVRTEFIKMAVNMWENEKGVLWNELWTTRVAAATGDATIVGSDLVYATPTNLRFLGGFIRTYNVNTTTQQSYWAIASPSEAELFKNIGRQSAYLTGNKSTGFFIEFFSQPTVDDTIDYPYYKEATAPSSGSDVLEMSDPYFVVYMALSKLHEQDGDGDRATVALTMAEQKLAAMRTLNAMVPNYQANPIPTTDVLLGREGFGY